MKRCWRATGARLKSPALSLSASVVFGVGLLAACRAAAPRGSSSVELVEPLPLAEAVAKGRTEARSGVVAEYAPPYPKGEPEKPAYPPEALATHAGEVVVYLTITIDATGRVTEAVPSWGRVNIPNTYSEDFLAAARQCVLRWRFEPARVVYWERDGGEDNHYLYSETIPSRTDVKVTFTTAGTRR
jgi:hypothetical protein